VISEPILSSLLSTRATEKELWRNSRPNYEAYSTPAIYKPKDGPAQVIVLGSNAVDAYSLDKGERLWWVTKIGSYPKGVPVMGAEMVYVTAEGGDEPFLPPFDEMAKQFDSNKDQRLHREEMKAQAEAYEHFGWLDANKDEYVDRADRIRLRTQFNGLGTRTYRSSVGRSGRRYSFERCLARQ
jgi:hypothetical protein